MGKAKTTREKKTQKRTKAECGEKPGKSIQRFDGRLPPILPEFRLPDREPFKSTGSGARRRIQLVYRAFSAAVYAHEDHFPLRRQGLLSEPTKKLLPVEKEQILCAFDAECQTVLNALRGLLGIQRPIPAAERIAVLKDYQSWAERLKELLKEALFVGEEEDWKQELNNHLADREACTRDSRAWMSSLVSLIKRPVFRRFPYLSKFDDLFTAQIRLEQRLGLMTDIFLDWIAGIEAARRPKNEPKKRGAPKKHSEVTVKAAETCFDQLQALGKPVNVCWFEVHKMFGFTSPGAAKQAVYRYRKQNKKQN